MALFRPRFAILDGAHLFLAAVLCLGIAEPPLTAQGQSQTDESAPDSTTVVGHLVYFEGEVGVNTDGTWRSAQIDHPLRPADRIGTAPNAKAEIEWTDGGQSSLGPADTQRVRRLYTQFEASASQTPASLYDRFRELFSEKTDASDDPGAIRRGAGTPFERATLLYRRNQFQDALPLFQKALNQYTSQGATGPAVHASKAALARFALAHCYLETGQREASRDALQSLVETHPESQSAELGRALLDSL